MAEWGIKHRAAAVPATALEGAILGIRREKGGLLTFFREPCSKLRDPAGVPGFIPQEPWGGYGITPLPRGGNTSVGQALPEGKFPLFAPPHSAGKLDHRLQARQGLRFQPLSHFTGRVLRPREGRGLSELAQ